MAGPQCPTGADRHKIQINTMKKINIFLLGALGFMASSCDETIEPSIPQHNPQEPIVTVDDVTSAKAGVLASDAVLNLEDYRAEGSVIPVMTLVNTENLPENATISYNLELSSTDSFEREVTLSTTAGEASEDGSVTYYVNAEEWNDAHLYLFGKSPKEKTVYYRVPVYVNLDGSDYRLNSIDYYAAEGTLTETCMDSGFVIEDHYYLLGDMTTWDLSESGVAPYAFEHAEDVSVYDDPVFVIKFEVPASLIESAGGAYWKIASQTAAENADWAAVIGPEINGDTALSGTLVSENAQAGKLEVAGKYKMTINMESMTYEIERLLQPDVLYTPGGANGWGFETSAYMQLHSSKGYYGVFPVDASGFKICTEASWDNAYTYGGKLADPALSGELLLGQDGKNLLVPAGDEGLIWASVQFDPVSYELTTYEFLPITQVSLIGSFAASAWSNDVVMTSNDNGITWTADVTFAAGDSYKIRFNSSWDYNLGGDPKALTFDGSDMQATESGEFTLTLTVQPGIPTLTIVKK